jgi:predicted DCC family thiol-disulfide oxidoreductase YuxK
MHANGPIVVFDTNCLLCSGMVAFVLAHEQAPVLRFAGAWSDEGVNLAAAHGFKASDLDKTFLVIRDGTALTRSDAAMEIARHLRAPWRWATITAIVPRPLRDAVYDFVARRRYRWFGKRQDCTVVPPTQRHRFIGVRASSNTV